MNQSNSNNGKTATSLILLDGLSTEAQRWVSQELEQLPVVNFAAEEKIIHEGFPALGVYLIERGRVKLAQRREGGRTLTIKIVSGGGMIGEESLLGDGVYNYFSETLTPVVARFFKQKRFQRLIQRYPQIWHTLDRKMALEIKALHGRLLEASFYSCKDKLARAITELAHAFGEPNEHGQMCLHWKRRDLAEVAGVSLEMVLRTLKEFERQHWIILQGDTITLLSSNGLSFYPHSAVTQGETPLITGRLC